MNVRKNHCCNCSSSSIFPINSIKKAIILLFLLLGGGTAQAQEVIRKGNVFEQVSKKKQKETYKLTQYTYIAADGKKYPIYISEKGKYFIFRKSVKTGKEYRQYLPKIQEQLECK
jgi:hypothetical protein